MDQHLASLYPIFPSTHTEWFPCPITIGLLAMMEEGVQDKFNPEYLKKCLKIDMAQKAFHKNSGSTFQQGVPQLVLSQVPH